MRLLAVAARLSVDKGWWWGHSEPVKKKKENSILWIEACGFSLLILMSWVTEVTGLPHLLFDEPFIPNWKRAFLRTMIILLVWAWVHAATRRLLKRLYYLEDFLRICSWCRKVCHDGKWMALEQYFSSKFATPTTHGMCPECMHKSLRELDAQLPPKPPEKASF